MGRRPHIDSYEVSKEDKIFDMLSKNNMIVDFIKVFNWDRKNKNLERINLFILKKKRIYADEIGELIAKYMNYFIKYYDSDNELILAYLKIKFFIDRKGPYTDSDFIEDLYEYLLTDSMKEKIVQLTEDNYITELDEDDEYSSSIQFTNKHAKILMAISIVTKMFAPLINHFAYVRGIKNISELILNSFDNLFGIFQQDTDLANKLYETANIRVLKTKQSDKGFWNDSIIFGITPESYVIHLVKKLMMDAIPKYEFKRNCISFNHVFLKNTINNNFRVKYKYERNPLTFSKSEDGLSGLIIS